MTVESDLRKAGGFVHAARVNQLPPKLRGDFRFELSLTFADGWYRTHALPLPVALDLVHQLIDRLVETFDAGQFIAAVAQELPPGLASRLSPDERDRRFHEILMRTYPKET